jgi:hypothetical protein
MIDFLNIDDNISDEMLAAYIDGNTTESENALIENSLDADSMLSEAYEIASDSISFGEKSDWDIYDGDYGYLEMGLPPVIDALDMVTQNQNYGLDFGNGSDLLGSETYPASNDLYGKNEEMGFDDTLMSSEMDDSSW